MAVSLFEAIIKQKNETCEKITEFSLRNFKISLCRCVAVRTSKYLLIIEH
jgi:hypothetical protein